MAKTTSQATKDAVLYYRRCLGSWKISTTIRACADKFGIAPSTLTRALARHRKEAK